MKHVQDMSGHCRFPSRDGGSHLTCRIEWDTPTATVECICPCHRENGQVKLVPKGPRAKVLVPKK